MPAARQWAYKRRRKIMGFRIRKSISFGKGFRVNLGKSGITSVTFGKRGAPHITTGRRGTRFGTPVVPGTGISYETRLDKPKTRQSRKESRKSTATAHEPDAVAQTSVIPTTLAEPGTGGNGNGGKSNGGRYRENKEAVLQALVVPRSGGPRRSDNHRIHLRAVIRSSGHRWHERCRGAAETQRHRLHQREGCWPDIR